MSTSGFFLGALAGIVGKTVFEIFKNELEKKDKYYFALLEHKFSAYQHAYFLCYELMHYIHEQDVTKRNALINDAKNWLAKNALYLKQEHRKSFNNFVLDFQFYPEMLEGSKTDSISSDELKETWKSLKSFHEELACEIDENYYKHTHGFSKFFCFRKQKRP